MSAMDIEAELWYPRSEDRPKGVVVSLVDLRAADDVRIEFDFGRNGWSIQQRVEMPIPSLDGVIFMSRDWYEQAFLPAWEGKAPDGVTPVREGDE